MYFIRKLYIRVNERQHNNTDCSTVSLVSLIVPCTFHINVNIESTLSESGGFCCLLHFPLKFWKHGMQCHIQFEAITDFQNLVIALDCGWEHKWKTYSSYYQDLTIPLSSPLHPLIQICSFPVQIVYIVPLVHIQVTYDQFTSLELDVQCFLLKYFMHIYAFQTVISVMQ